MRFLYQIGVFAYLMAIRLASVFSDKAKHWVKGRQNIFEKLRAIPAHPGKTVWVHCASLGEFEQGRPVMEALKRQYSDLRIVLTFFSPSGYEIRKKYTGADFIFYLPADLPGAAVKFYDAVSPDIGIFVKYEFWQGYLHEAKKRNIKLLLISGIFRKEMPFFKFYGSFFREGLKAFHHLFIQDENSRELLAGIGIKKVTVCGDTRLDRVLETAENPKEISLLGSFKNDKLLWVCGSSWPADDAIILPIVAKHKKRIKTLLVPHDIHEEYIRQLPDKYPSLVFSRFTDKISNPDADVLILDTVGLLGSAYRYGDFAYVGGGFGKAVHNTMEAAVFGIPVMFGPKHEKFREIAGLMQYRGGVCVSDSHDMEYFVVSCIENAKERQEKGLDARRYVLEHSGATEIIMKHINGLIAKK